jgi:hypothetical protein
VREHSTATPSTTSRRNWLLLLGGVSAALVAAKLSRSALTDPRRASLSATPPQGDGRDFGNFATIYGRPELRAEFRHFLDNVFHLYPTDALDELIADCVRHDPRDGAVFRQLEARLAEVTPLLGSIRYALPALAKQKAVMAEQTKQLLGARRGFEGYLEIGSHGRYYDALHSILDIRGKVFTVAPKPPTHSPEDIVDRGALALVGTPLPWTDYAPLSGIQPGSLDLITVFIGFHHAAMEARASYLRSIRELLSSDGMLIVRDHNVVSPELDRLVGLAHDVFNVGTLESFETNNRERRNFYALDTLVQLLESEGLVADDGRCLQQGDPTHNTLLAFSKGARV